MNLREVLIILVLFWVIEANAQNTAKCIQPEYKIRWRDTVGRVIQIVNYYDRSFYTKDIQIKKILANGSSQYYSILINPVSGIGIIPKSITSKVNLQIGKTLEIENIEFKEGKINRIEIRSEGGFVSLPLKWGRAKYGKITGILKSANDSITTLVTAPAIQELPRGIYMLTLNTLPQIHKTIYLKPSSIFNFSIYKSIPFQIVSSNRYSDYKLYYSHYPYKDYKLCQEGKFDTNLFEIYLQPKKLYEIRYRKKGRKRYHKKKFYMDSSMDVFIMELD